MKDPAIIVDLDNTLALIGDRNPYDASECGYDKLNHIVYRMIFKYQDAGYKLIILSGRKATYTKETMGWLQKYYINPDMLIIRNKGDNQPAFSFKHRAYNQYIKNKFEVEFALDDDIQVIEMWRSIGVPCFHLDGRGREWSGFQIKLAEESKE